MRIRKFRSSDAIQVAQMHRGTIRSVNAKDYPRAQIRVWSGRVSAKRHRNPKELTNRVKYVALDKKKVVGFGDLDKTGELMGLYIHKDYQGKGVGTKILTILESEARKIGLKKLTLTSTLSALNFYKRQGYRILKKTHYRIKNQNLAVYEMKKAL